MCLGWVVFCALSRGFAHVEQNPIRLANATSKWKNEETLWDEQQHRLSIAMIMVTMNVDLQEQAVVKVKAKVQFVRRVTGMRLMG